MITYYVEKDNKIIGADSSYEALKNSLLYKDLEIKETERPIVDFQFADTEEYQQKQIKKREEHFKSEFFEIPNVGWYRKIPKGYSSAIENINTIANAISLGAENVPANTFIFYKAPDFHDETQCNEDWLEANHFKNEEMDKSTFINFYMSFIESWNKTEH